MQRSRTAGDADDASREGPPTAPAVGPSERHFERLFRTHPDGVFIADAAGGLLSVNPALSELLGRPEAEVLGLGIEDFLVPLEHAQEPAPARGDACLRLPDGGERLVRIRTVPLLDGAGRTVGHQGVVRDVGEQRQAEAALREQEEQLGQAQTLEAVGRLAGGIAHDFNNLLMVIQGSVNLLLMDEAPGPRWRDDLQEILRATERAAVLTRQLLAFSRKQVLRPRVVDLNAALGELREPLREELGEGIALDLRLQPGLWPVRVDPNQLAQVVHGLVANSRDAMQGAGRLTIRTANAELTAQEAQRLPYQVVPGLYVRLTVRDTGCGISEGELPHVFEPFYTTKEQGKGTGLGLSMVYGIVKQSGGYIWASSTPGDGATFDIYLPKLDAADPSGTVLAGDRPAPGTGTILLVEDEEPVRSVTRRFLERGGYRVLEAASGPEALRLFDQVGGAIDLLLTDVVMPGMGGRELATRLVARRPGLRVLYMSGYGDDRGLGQDGEGREGDFIQKPYDLAALLERVGGMLAG
jgi:two-component system, cell cycle sensor histidine kinase and response regulator CckA